MLLVIFVTQYEVQLSFSIKSFDESNQNEVSSEIQPDIHPLSEGEFLRHVMNSKEYHHLRISNETFVNSISTNLTIEAAPDSNTTEDFDNSKLIVYVDR